MGGSYNEKKDVGTAIIKGETLMLTAWKKNMAVCCLRSPTTKRRFGRALRGGERPLHGVGWEGVDGGTTGK